MMTQVKFLRLEEPAEGLRSRKKAKTRVMIEDAALRLFAEQGYEATTVEQIAAAVDVSTTTFFRYFPSKADVILCHQDAHLPLLRETFLARPRHETDLAALEYAMLEVWVPNIDPEHTLRSGLAVANSATLRGLYNDLNRSWLDDVAKLVAERRGLDVPDLRAMITARVAIGAFNEAIRLWSNHRHDEAIVAVVEEAFDTVRTLAGEWAH